MTEQRLDEDVSAVARKMHKAMLAKKGSDSDEEAAMAASRQTNEAKLKDPNRRAAAYAQLREAGFKVIKKSKGLLVSLNRGVGTLEVKAALDAGNYTKISQVGKSVYVE